MKNLCSHLKNSLRIRKSYFLKGAFFINEKVLENLAYRQVFMAKALVVLVQIGKCLLYFPICYRRLGSGGFFTPPKYYFFAEFPIFLGFFLFPCSVALS